MALRMIVAILVCHRVSCGERRHISHWRALAAARHAYFQCMHSCDSCCACTLGLTEQAPRYLGLPAVTDCIKLVALSPHRVQATPLYLFVAQEFYAFGLTSRRATFPMHAISAYEPHACEWPFDSRHMANFTVRWHYREENEENEEKLLLGAKR